MATYVVLAPDHLRGCYPTWAACEAAVRGVPGAKFQKCRTEAEATALLAGATPAPLTPGLYGVVDGNHHGGIGIVLLTQVGTARPTTREESTTLAAVFPNGIPLCPDTAVSVPEALACIRNVAAELGAVYHALRFAPCNSTVTIVHDYKGIAAWMEGRWAARDPIVRALLTQIQQRIAIYGLTVQYRHQPGHRPDCLGTDPLIQANRRADALATAVAGGHRR